MIDKTSKEKLAKFNVRLKEEEANFGNFYLCPNACVRVGLKRQLTLSTGALNVVTYLIIRTTQRQLTFEDKDKRIADERARNKSQGTQLDFLDFIIILKILQEILFLFP